MSNPDREHAAGPAIGSPKLGSTQLGFLHVAAFARVVDAGSFTAAARQMHLSKGTVSKRVAHLESLLGASLITRTTRSLRVTEQGARFYSHCLNILDEWAAAETELLEAKRAPRGRLRVCVPSHFGSERIAPALQEFMDRFPDIEIDLSLVDEPALGLGEEADVALRIGPMAKPGGRSIFLARCIRRICAAPSYLKRHGTPSTVRELGQHNCLCLGHNAGGATWSLEGPAGLEAVAVSGRFRADNEDAIRNAALSGLGLALMPAPFVESDIVAGRMVGVLPRYRDHSHALYMDYGERGPTPEAQAFVAFLKTCYQSMTVIDTAATVPGSRSHES